ncbi:MAG: hypothetical protein U5K54_12335 [Cytophagales bacterium]|nr:hypothetical protein [Cytophagales bacterium]
MIVCIHLNNRGPAIDTGYINTTVSGKIAHAVSNKFILINFNSLRYMWPMAEDNIGTSIYKGMREFIHIAPVFAIKHLMLARNMLVLRSFGPTMEGHYDNISKRI